MTKNWKWWAAAIGGLLVTVGTLLTYLGGGTPPRPPEPPPETRPASPDGWKPDIAPLAVQEVLRSLPDNLERQFNLAPDVAEAIGITVDAALNDVADGLSLFANDVDG